LSKLSVFIAESVSPNDFYIGQTDGFAAKEILNIQRVRTQYRIALTRPLLARAIRDAATGVFSAFHLSCHGDEDGIRLADKTDVDWPELARMLRPFALRSRFLVMSSCSGGYVGFSKALQKEGVTFGYIFGSTAPSETGVGFTHSCLAWSVLYNRLVEAKFSTKELRRTLDKINALVPGDFVYRRWNGSRYLTYPTFKIGGPRPRGS